MIEYSLHNISSIPNFCCGVYAIRNNMDNKMYIGSSTGTLLNTYQSIGQASKMTNIAKSAIQSVLNVKKINKTAGGYIWKYKEGGNNE